MARGRLALPLNEDRIEHRGALVRDRVDGSNARVHQRGRTGCADTDIEAGAGDKSLQSLRRVVAANNGA